jgi:hypothetical protein
MDAAIADTINRLDAQKVASHLDLLDWFKGGPPWHLGIEAQAFLSNTCGSGEKAWLFGALAAGVPNLHFDGDPADCDWDGLFTHFRAEVLARRDEAPLVHANESVRDGVGSR